MFISLRGLTRTMTEHIPKVSSAVTATTVAVAGMSRQKSDAVASNGSNDMSYENAVKVLHHNLMSNAETIAKARQNLDKKRVHIIPNMNNYIQRSGLTQEDVDKLSVIHVSGTKGKGSTCAFCERILGCHGYKTGLFSSPHLVQVRERIRINGRPISEQMFCKYFWKVYNKLEESQNENNLSADEGGGMPPYFAFLTVLSLHVFLGEGVDVAVMEVGIGGQYDSTNFFRKPAVCGVTSLGLDHVSLLGHTIEEIAWNKAGIFKPGRPAITAPQEQAALEVILERAVEKQIVVVFIEPQAPELQPFRPLHAVKICDPPSENEDKSPLYVSKAMSAEQMEKYKIHLGIAGDKQVENGSLAVQLFKMWEKVHGKDTAMKMDIPTADTTLSEIPVMEVSRLDHDTVKGLSSCVWPGRAQTLSREKITYYLDGAHTKESIEVCAEWFKKAADGEVKARRGKVARILVFNTTGDRDVAPFLACLRECNFDAAVFCTNILSMVEEVNRPDQLNKTVTPRWMFERAESNKASWDTLQRGRQAAQDPAVCSNSHPGNFDVDHNSNTLFVERGDSARGICSTKDTNNDCSVKRQKLSGCSDHSAVNSAPHDAVNHSDTQSISRSGSSSNDIDDHHHPQTNLAAAGASGSNPNSRNASIINSHHQKVEPSNRPSHPTDSAENSNHQNVDENIIPSCNVASSPPQTESQTSLSFPCILQALAWATQGRDPLVEVKDPSFIMPHIPEHLRDSDYVQVLVTGSLHLVGGVLGVIDPHMND